MKYFYKLNSDGSVFTVYKKEVCAGLLYTEEPNISWQLVKWNGESWVIDTDKQSKADSDTAKTQLKFTDQGMIRVVEDLISLLLQKKVITEEELPQIIKNRIEERISLREKL